MVWTIFYYFVGRKLSPTPPNNRLAIEAPNEKDEGISDEEDPAELRILLELNEQVKTHNFF